MADHVNQTGSNKKSKTTQQGGSIMRKTGSTNGSNVSSKDIATSTVPDTVHMAS